MLIPSRIGMYFWGTHGNSVVSELPYSLCYYYVDSPGTISVGEPFDRKKSDGAIRRVYGPRRSV